ncbi:MAG: PRC-barrel domain containing protein [Methylacidiphilales bacterium]|nr:PRC-barrel domain containing protein [Candidatus Methylacidiphilales bacterium]
MSTKPLTPGTNTGSPGPITFQQSPLPGEVLASELLDANIYGSDGAAIGEINDIVVDQAGQVHAVVFGVGGLLGMGEKNVAVPFKSLQVSQIPSGAARSSDRATSSSDWNNRNRITLNATKDQLKSAPEFKVQRLMTTGSLTGSSSTSTR